MIYYNMNRIIIISTRSTRTALVHFARARDRNYRTSVKGPRMMLDDIETTRVVGFVTAAYVRRARNHS